MHKCRLLWEGGGGESSQRDHTLSTSANFLGFWTPSPPLVRILARSIRVNPRNLPYYVCFWANPPPPLVWTSFMYGPLLLSIAQDC